MAIKKKTQTKKKVETMDISQEKAPSKKIVSQENRQLIWFFVIIIVAFAAFLIPYFYVQSLKSFDYAGANWTIEDDNQYFHGRFPVLNGENIHYNLYLKNDPRLNNVPTEGTFDQFRYGGYISFDRDINSCRGEISRIMVDLGSFLNTGVGIKQVTAAASNTDFANESGLPFVDCSNTPDRTIVIIQKGEENKVAQSTINPNCYIIQVKDCNDGTSVEKFMVEVISAFREKE